MIYAPWQTKAQHWIGGKRKGLITTFSYLNWLYPEASKGHPEASQRRLSVIYELPLIVISEEVRGLAQALIEDHALPHKAEADAYHVAIAVVHGIEYLLTWNCTHIANAHTRPKIEATCRRLGYEPPVICTPLELIED